MPTTSEIRTPLTSLHAREQKSVSEGSSADARAASIEAGTQGPAIETDVFQPVSSPKLLELVELILKDRPRLERVIRDPSLAAELIPRFLAVSLVGFTLFGVAMALVVHAVGVRLELASMKAVLEGTAPGLVRFEPLGARSGREMVNAITAGLRLISAYDLGLIAAAGVCLPSLYFYGLLAGIPMSLARVTVHTVKAMATTAVALVGILPIYVAFSLGAAIFHAPAVVAESVLWLGLLLPFGAGLFGVNSLYTGFTGLTNSLPPECRYRRSCFLRRLVVSWSVCYTAVTPVMIFTLWEYFSRTT
ncbi:MAG: hypothetical protein ACM3U2_00470 [Deltaproteobacteria bacterium]